MSLIKYALLISVPDLADVGDPLGGKGCLLPPKFWPDGPDQKSAPHFEQHEKLKGRQQFLKRVNWPWSYVTDVLF